MEDFKITKGKNKPIVEVSDGYIFIRKLFHTKKVKIKDIRSSYLCGDLFYITTYNNKLVTKRVGALDEKEKELLYRIIGYINKEDIIYGYNEVYNPSSCFMMAIIPFVNSISDNIILVLISFIVLILLCFYLQRSVYDKVFKMTYDINKKVFIYNNKGAINEYHCEEIEMIRDYYSYSYYHVKGTKIHFYMSNSIIRPIEYKVALCEINKNISR